MRNKRNRRFFAEIEKSLDNGDILLMCYFAPSVKSYYSEEEKYENGVKLFQNYIRKNIDYIPANRKEFISQLKKADAVYIHGGGTEELYRDLEKQQSEFEKEIMNKKLVVGSSAGAYVLAEYSIDYAGESKPVRRFGILPIKIHCHFEEKNRKSLEEKFKQVDPKDKLETVFLKDGEMKVNEKRDKKACW